MHREAFRRDPVTGCGFKGQTGKPIGPLSLRDTLNSMQSLSLRNQWDVIQN